MKLIISNDTVTDQKRGIVEEDVKSFANFKRQ